MGKSEKHDITHLLQGLGGEQREAIIAQLMPLVYDELRRVAGKYFRDERPDHTLQPTALVHEAYLRLVDQTRVDWQSRAHFFAICAKIMRRILVDHARGRKRARRGGGRRKLTLDSDVLPADLGADEILMLHDALERLAALDERQARVVEMRFFAGLTMEEVAQALNVSKRTAEDDWTHAKAWLRVHAAAGPDA